MVTHPPHPQPNKPWDKLRHKSLTPTATPPIGCGEFNLTCGSFQTCNQATVTIGQAKGNIPVAAAHIRLSTVFGEGANVTASAAKELSEFFAVLHLQLKHAYGCLPARKSRYERDPLAEELAAEAAANAAA